MPSSPTEILLPHRPTDATPPAAVTDGEHHSLFVALAAVPDPRDPRGRRYPLVGIISVAVCAVLAGACTFAAITDWMRDLGRPLWDRLGFTNRVPAATTVWRLLIRIDTEVLSAVLARWLRARAAPVVIAGRRWRLVIAVEGKVERGTRLSDGRQVHLLSAYDTSTGIVLAQVQIAPKSNEIPHSRRCCSTSPPSWIAERRPRRRGRVTRPDRPRRPARRCRRAFDGRGQG
jgi:hypothetical protein